jgi:hypothetical protein
MGSLLDRANEHLGTADIMVMRIRQRLLDVVRAHGSEKLVPPGLDDPEVYRTRPVGCTLPVDADWLAATEALRASQ